MAPSKKSLRKPEGTQTPEGVSLDLFNDHPVPMWIYDRETLGFLAVNDAAVTKYGYTRKKFLSLTIKDIRPEEDVPALEANVAAPRPVLQQTGGWRHQLKDGRVIDVEITSHLLEYNGRPAALVIAQDVTEQKRIESDLRASHRFAQEALDALADHIAILDENGVILTVNRSWRAFAEANGGNLEEAGPGVNYLAVCDKVRGGDTQGAAEMAAGIRAVLSGDQETFLVEYPCHSPYEYRWFIGRVSRFSDDQPKRVVISHTDISGRVLTEQALRNNEQRFQALIENSVDAITLIDRQGRVIYDSPAAPGLLGYGPAEFIGASVLDILHPEDQPAVRSLLLELSERPGSSRSSIFRLRHKQGDWLWIEAVARNFLDVNSIQAIVVNYRDVTRRLEAEQTLQLQSTALEAAANGIVISNSTDAIEWANPAFTELTGYPVDEAMGKSSIELLNSGLNPPEVLEELRRTISTGQVWQGELLSRRRDGSTYTEMQTITPVLSERGSVSHFIAIKKDVTERKTAERQLREHLSYLEALNAVTAAIGGTLELDPLLDIILENVQQVIPFSSASIMLMEDEAVQIARYRGQSDREVAHFVSTPTMLLADYPFLRRMLEEGAPILLSDTRSAPEWTQFEVSSWIRSYLGVPISRGGQMIGFLNLDGAQPAQFTENDAKMLQAFSGAVAAALQNAELYAAAQRATERRETLHAAMQDVLRNSTSMEVLYEALYGAARRLMPCEAFVLTLQQEQDATLGVGYSIDQGEEFPAEPFVLAGSLTAHMLEYGRPYLIDDVKLDKLPAARHFGGEEAVRSLVAVPLVSAGKPLGMLSAQSYRPNAYSAEDLRILELLAGQTAALVVNTRLYEATQQQVKQLSALHAVSAALRTADTVDSALTLLLDETLTALDTDAGCILLYNKASGMLEGNVARGWFRDLGDLSMKPGEGIVGRVFSSDKPSRVTDFSIELMADAAFNDVIPSGWSGAGMPIRSALEVSGVFLVSVPSERPLSSDQLRLLGSLAEMAGITLHRMGLHSETVRRLSNLQALRAVDQAISSSLDLKLTLNILLRFVMAQLDVDAANVLLVNPETFVLEYAAGRGFSHPVEFGTLPIGEGWAGAVAEKRLPFSSHEPPSAETNPSFAKFWENEGFEAYYALPLVSKGQVTGVLEVFQRGPLTVEPSWLDFLETLAGQAAIAIESKQLVASLQSANVQLTMAYDATIEGWSRALDLRDKETEGHSLRVTEITLQLALELGFPDEELEHIRRGALLHDIGKMGIPDSILLKPSQLTDIEWEVMRRHPLYAYEMLSPIAYLLPALDIPYCHHEKWDGSGYPRGLQGDNIPFAARIFAVVDVWDALISDRPYRPAWTQERALAHIQNESGKHFDPHVAGVFLDSIIPSLMAK